MPGKAASSKAAPLPCIQAASSGPVMEALSTRPTTWPPAVAWSTVRTATPSNNPSPSSSNPAPYNSIVTGTPEALPSRM